MVLGKLIRENTALVVGASMPIGVVILFLAATHVPRFFVDPPQYDFVFSDQGPRSSRPSRWVYTIDVDAQRRIRVQAVWQAEEGYHGGERLFIYEHESDSVREIRIPLLEPSRPAEQEAPAELRHTIDVPELRDVIVDERRVAPDGYEFSEPQYRGGGLFGLFYRGGEARATISKNGAVVEIDQAVSRPFYNSIRFHGWVLPTSEQ